MDSPPISELREPLVLFHLLRASACPAEASVRRRMSPWRVFFLCPTTMHGGRLSQSDTHIQGLVNLAFLQAAGRAYSLALSPKWALHLFRRPFRTRCEDEAHLACKPRGAVQTQPFPLMILARLTP